MSQGIAVPEAEANPTGPIDRPVNTAAPPWRWGFWSLVITQFQGAFNENGLKNLVVFLILGMAVEEASHDQLVLVVGPFFRLHSFSSL